MGYCSGKGMVVGLLDMVIIYTLPFSWPPPSFGLKVNISYSLFKAEQSSIAFRIFKEHKAILFVPGSLSKEHRSEPLGDWVKVMCRPQTKSQE